MGEGGGLDESNFVIAVAYTWFLNGVGRVKETALRGKWRGGVSTTKDKFSHLSLAVPQIFRTFLLFAIIYLQVLVFFFSVVFNQNQIKSQ